MNGARDAISTFGEVGRTLGFFRLASPSECVRCPVIFTKRYSRKCKTGEVHFLINFINDKTHGFNTKTLFLCQIKTKIVNSLG